MIVGEIARAVLNYDGEGVSAVQNVFYWDLSLLAQSDAVVLTAIADWAELTWGPVWAAGADVNTLLTSVAVDIVTTAGLVDRNLGSASFTVPGTDTGETNPAACSGYLQANTGTPKTRGRKFLYGAGNGDIVRGLWGATYLAELALALTEYLTLIDIGGVSNLNPGVIATVLAVFKQFSGSGVVTNVPAYQRRRKPGVGI